MYRTSFQDILLIFKGQNAGAVFEHGSNVHYNPSGNIVMTISGRQQNPNQYYPYAQFPSTQPVYGREPPPSYSDIQNGKTPSVSYTPGQQQGEYNLAVNLGGEASLQRGSPLHEEPPPSYERIQPQTN